MRYVQQRHHVLWAYEIKPPRVSSLILTLKFSVNLTSQPHPSTLRLNLASEPHLSNLPIRSTCDAHFIVVVLRDKLSKAQTAL